MKKSFVFVALLVAFALVVSCSSNGAGGEKALVAPDMGAPTAIPTIADATAPTGEAGAKTLYTETMDALGSALMQNAIAKGLRSKESQTYSEPISWSGSLGGGTASVTGNVSYTMTSSDNWPPTANGVYNDIMSILASVTLDGTVTSVTVTKPSDAVVTYTISGKLVQGIDMDVNVDMNVTNVQAQQATADMDLAFALTYGVALSVKRSDGMGAKFILSYAGRVNKQNVPLDDPDQSADQSGIEQLMASKATLKVYNAATDALLYSSEIGVDELVGGELGSMFSGT